ncbi:TVP38/TMEM64 family protein [Hoeflea sp. WL0058]|uniref:TVP38/TMEM64 family membrane protein n=1 Tax=Flavimaribacter sediminis TaxID=2865987 RepID=A0AAE2ZNC9_9HYPH|nr:TVP38/TMEM64 family protein [Flavimaribacter sediminis]MBW8637875.1 TVP38/TMEM64 family protein [Flavimaribacter sediminis]
MTVTEHDGELDGKTENRSGFRLVARRFIPVLMILGGLLLGYMLGLHRFLSLEAIVENREYLKSYVGDHVYMASLIYFIVYTAAVAFAFPAASLLTILGGFLFGWFWGGVLTAVAATIGATVLFLAAKSALGDVLKKKAGPAVSRAADNFQEDAFGYLLVLRLAPIFPFFAINIAPAFFNVGLRTYVLATLIGILPGTFAYAYLGEGLDSVIVSAAAAGETLSLSDIVTPELTIAFFALAVIAAIPLAVKKYWRRSGGSS